LAAPVRQGLKALPAFTNLQPSMGAPGGMRPFCIALMRNVMPGLVPGIRAFAIWPRKTWMAGT